MRRARASSRSLSDSLAANTLLYNLVIRYFSRPCRHTVVQPSVLNAVHTAHTPSDAGHPHWGKVTTARATAHLDGLLLVLARGAGPHRVRPERCLAFQQKILQMPL